MTITHTTAAVASETSGIFAEAIGGIATIALAIIALAGTAPEFLLAVATVVFGAALLIEGTSIVTEYAFATASGAVGLATGGLAAVFLAGLSGIILGILALLGVHAPVVTSAAVITFGSALLLNSGSMFNLYAVKSGEGSALMMSSAVGTAGAQALAGIAAIVMGILALAGNQPMSLALVALLVLGAAILVTGNGMGKAAVHVFSRFPNRA
jgi:hypothetical protein